MPRVSKTMRQLQADEEQDKTLTGDPTSETTVVTRTEPPVHVPASDVPQPNIDRAQLETLAKVPQPGLTYDDVAHAADEMKAQKEWEVERGMLPLLTIHLRRIGTEMTDSAHTVHIPAPALVAVGENVRVEVYRES